MGAEEPPPGPDNATPCRAGPVCPAGGAGKIRFGPSGTPAPTEALQEVQWAGDRKGRPYGGVTNRISQGLPHPFSPHFLFSVCGFPVDKLSLPISPPFLWKSIISPVDKKSMHFAALRGFSTKVFSTTIITKKYLVYVLWAENMPGNFGIRKESVPC